jgi:hypothetical protein
MKGFVNRFLLRAGLWAVGLAALYHLFGCEGERQGQRPAWGVQINESVSADNLTLSLSEFGQGTQVRLTLLPQKNQPTQPTTVTATVLATGATPATTTVTTTVTNPAGGPGFDFLTFINNEARSGKTAQQILQDLQNMDLTKQVPQNILNELAQGKIP